MAITMQGSWTVRVKSKNAAYGQQFVIAGAEIGSGTYPGLEDEQPVFVDGDSWTITIQADPGTGFIDSEDQVKFPTVSQNTYWFDIESDDSYGDQDFNDLILTCSTPVTETDFIVYGNVNCYEGPPCFINPCFKNWVVIDSAISLQEVMKNPYLRRAVEELYPDRMDVEPFRIGPFPDPPPFRPMLIPLQERGGLPPRRAQVMKLGAEPAQQATKKKAGQPVSRPVSFLRSFEIDRPLERAYAYDRAEIARLADRLRLFCDVDPLAGVVLRFQEYDRTGAELAGGAYTGEGDREALGICVTDRNGNYIFRFHRSVEEFFEEAGVDVAEGEDVIVQRYPDIIAQVLDAMAPSGVSYESAPYWNVPVLRRINICKRGCMRNPSACQGGNAIQAIGNIFIGSPQADGTRVGFNNFLGADGHITARNTLSNVPQARCAAWAGRLDLFACFLDVPDVEHYTIRYRRLGETDWNFFQEEYRHPKISELWRPDYNGDPVGPVDVEVTSNGEPLLAKVYENIENDSAWVFTHRDRKAIITSWFYAPVPGPVEFWIEGYDKDYAKVPGAEDVITLFIDNTDPVLAIDSVELLGAPGDDCALFTLPADQLNAPLTVKFKANQESGHMNAYGLTVRKGNVGEVEIQSAGPELIAAQYVHGDDLVCNVLHGTTDDLAADGYGFVTADVVPNNGGWLDSAQPFCTFAVQLSCSTRVTNGLNSAVNGYGPKQYLLGLQQ